MNSHWYRFLLATILGLLAGVVQAQTVIAVDAADPPFMSADSQGRAVGLYPTLIEAVFKQAGEPVAVKPFPWKRALEMGQRGNTGIGGIYKTTERKKIYDYSHKIFDEKLLIYVRKGHGFPFHGIADLKGKSIGVIRGWSYGDAFDHAKQQGEFTTQPTNGDEPNFEKLAAGRMDCVVAIELAGQYVIAKDHLANIIAVLPQPLVVNPTYVIFAKKANLQPALDRFDQALAAMKADGRYNKVISDFMQRQLSH